MANRIFLMIFNSNINYVYVDLENKSFSTVYTNIIKESKIEFEIFDDNKDGIDRFLEFMESLEISTDIVVYDDYIIEGND